MLLKFYKCYKQKSRISDRKFIAQSTNVLISELMDFSEFLRPMHLNISHYVSDIESVPVLRLAFS